VKPTIVVTVALARGASTESSRPGVRGDRELGGMFGAVCQTSQDSLRATENCDAVRLTPLHSRPYEAERVHGARGKQWSLIGGYPHKILPRTKSSAGRDGKSNDHDGTGLDGGCTMKATLARLFGCRIDPGKAVLSGGAVFIRI
jgi:hypothetical protein